MDRQRMTLVSPTGSEIVGTLETVSARADIVPGTARKDELGGIEFEYNGNTELIWEEQCTVVRDDERVFLDVEGNEFLESQLRLLPEGTEIPDADVGGNVT